MAAHALHDVVSDAHLSQYGHHLPVVQSLKVLTARGDHQSGHVQRAGRHHTALPAFGIVAVGTVLGPWEDHCDLVAALPPHYNIHHGLPVGAVVPIGGLPHVALHHGIEPLEKSPADLRASRHDSKGRTGPASQQAQPVVGAAVGEGFQAPGQPLPLVAQRQLSAAPSLQMQMIGGGGSAPGAVVEHGQAAFTLQQGRHDAVVACDALGLVTEGGNGEMHGQDGKRIDEKVELRVVGQADLLWRAVFIAEEAAPVGQNFPADAGSRRDDAGGIELQAQRQANGVVRGGLHPPHLNRQQVAIAAADLVPKLQLAVEEADEGTLVPDRWTTRGVELPAGPELQGAQAVLIAVVGIGLLNAQLMVAVASPPSAEIELVEDTSDAPVTAEGQTHGIVLAIAGVGKVNLPHQGGEEGTGSP